MQIAKGDALLDAQVHDCTRMAMMWQGERDGWAKHGCGQCAGVQMAGSECLRDWPLALSFQAGGSAGLLSLFACTQCKRCGERVCVARLLSV
eukprot:360411-Chlamydomonas_euryale.AAC.1